MTQRPTGGGDDRSDDADEPGGETACALHRVCDACGALEDGPPAPVCGRCGAARTGVRPVAPARRL